MSALGEQRNDKVLKPELTQIMENFSDVFEVPHELPPKRSHDHRIPLIPGTPPVNIRPYRHPLIQKDVIEAMVKELLESGVIKPSQSPFSSPIVMVCKDEEDKQYLGSGYHQNDRKPSQIGQNLCMEWKKTVKNQGQSPKKLPKSESFTEESAKGVNGVRNCKNTIGMQS
ncbi:hypothetical protein Tco_0392821 [Tanacetum coccineum]